MCLQCRFVPSLTPLLKFGRLWCSLTVQGMNLRCLCITKERALIGRLIGAVEVNLASSYCTEVEIIATLVKSEKKICLDPEASWVKKVLNAMKKRPG
uniref:C-X-C motif chemokine n=1 Tax=Oryzias melastigma TaxID=30732 RepID=A0A3B3C2G2_ORYME